MTTLLSGTLKAIAQTLGTCATLNVPLATYSGVGVGGPADLLVIAQNRDVLIKAVQMARDAQIPWHVFGGLTNMLLPDAGVRGLTVLNHSRAVVYEPSPRIYAEAGALIVKVAREAVRSGWGGLTWAVGLPGTIGGAVINNAGAFGGEISRTLISAEVLGPKGQRQEVGPDWFDFEYRYSRLKGTDQAWVVLSATFQLKPRSAEYLAKKAAEYNERRRRTQPPGKTLGSTFKNPQGDYAGRLIEAAGLKGKRVGGFVISEKHANFFVNQGEGTAADYQALIHWVQDEVLDKFGVHLEPEIEIL